VSQTNSSTDAAGLTSTCSDNFASVCSDYLSIFFINATSLAKPGAVQLLETELLHGKYSIALVAETWFTEQHLDSIVSIGCYSLFRCDRHSRKGGGVCAYVRNDITCHYFHPHHSYSENLEILWLECHYNRTNYYIACCYYPPRPIYSSFDFINALSADIDAIIRLNDHSVIVIAGDFNQLNTQFLVTDYGLTQIVDQPTHGDNYLDKVFVNLPDVYSSVVFKSIIKTKHRAIGLSSVTPMPCPSDKRRKVRVFDLRSHNIDKLRYYIGGCDWSRLLSSTDVNFIYAQFVSCISQLIDFCIPSRIVTLGHKDPSFVTPLVKLLLPKRYRLRRQGRITEASELAIKINNLIATQRQSSLAKLVNAGPKELWASVRQSGGSSQSACRLNQGDADCINDYFANVATNTDYNRSAVMKYYTGNADIREVPSLADYEVELCLRRIAKTSPGSDNLPAWVFRSCSYELAGIVSHIFNSTFSTGTIPSSWLTAIVTPVPKVSKPVAFADYRPISVTPILSRLAEKIVVHRWLRPALAPSLFLDQYAFKPTGSCTAALAHFTHHASLMLEKNRYVRCLAIDFSKAFDSVDHEILLAKMVHLNIPSALVNWICMFLTGRSQMCKINGQLSSPRLISQSIVQGSGIGPTLYIIMKSDLAPLSSCNQLLKYADDTTLLVPENSDTELGTEFNHITDWATRNRLKINTKKTKEIVLRQPRARYFDMPVPLDGVERVVCLKLLGVIFESNFRFNAHVDSLLSQCSQRLYLIKLLRSQGMNIDHLDQVTHALIISRLRYALPVWSGFLTVDLSNRIEGLLKRLKRGGYLKEYISFAKLSIDVSHDLFLKAQSPNHCLNHLLPVCRPLDTLRPRGHNYFLPEYCTELHKRSFIINTLYRFV